ncbi:MAG: N-acetylmuramoyl-L-alanine amidase [Nitrospiraceae bacterium]|nr:N-acetylmuramoyl-L-alanine amidase [Nitrospiraceae bacterium]
MVYAEADAQKVNPQPVQQAADMKERGLIRAGKHHNYFRIVIETSESNTQKASVVFGKNNTINIDFRSAIRISTSKGDEVKQEKAIDLLKGVRISGSGAKYVITVDGLDDISVSKLSLPSRIVIDAYYLKNSQQAQKDNQPSAADVSVLFNSIVIDPGHGGADIGITGATFKEKEFALAFSRDFGAIISKKGKTAVLTRKSDQSLSLADRIKTANKRNPDIVISFHLSSKPELAVYSYSKALKKLGESSGADADKESGSADHSAALNIAATVKKELSINTRHEKLPLPIIKYTAMPAFVIELPSPDHYKYDKKTREAMMNAIIRGLKTNE